MPISEGVFTMQSGTWLGLLANVTAVEINVEIASNGTGPELETWGLDNVQLYSAAVPEMPTALLTIAGLVLLRSRNSVSFIVGKLKR